MKGIKFFIELEQDNKYLKNENKILKEQIENLRNTNGELLDQINFKRKNYRQIIESEYKNKLLEHKHTIKIRKHLEKRLEQDIALDKNILDTVTAYIKICKYLNN